jgi:hypothetical protein
MTIKFSLRALILVVSVAVAAAAQDISGPEPQTSAILGTVLNVNGGPVPGAQVNLQGPLPADGSRALTNENGFFELDHLRAQAPYHVTISATGFGDWASQEIILNPGQFQELTGIRLKIAGAVTTVRATASIEEIATEQVEIAEHQRVLGVIPNFYVVYDPQPAPLTPKLKFKLALKTTTDPVTIAGSAVVAGLDQAADKFSYEDGAEGYAQRFGADYANSFTSIMIGAAVLPSILHQDPRYFYLGTGTTKSRILHAVSYPFICRGDNGHLQPNYSSLGGFLASGAIANAYYPASDRGAGLMLNIAMVDIGASVAKGLLQEFVLRRFTSSGKQ